MASDSPARRLVLASASPARLRLLLGAGFEPEVIVSGVDEAAFAAGDLTELVTTLAEAKAGAVAARPDAAGAVVVACDSMLDVDGEAHGKPVDEAEARARLQRLRGRSAILRTGHCVVDTATGRRASAAAATEVAFTRFTDTELDAYLATGEPLHVAGAFTLDGWFAPFVERIIGDHGNVIGLSLPLFRELLAEVGLTVMDLWP
ncbi:MAG TPA: Maf family protein [Acidimicrobiia bacterium]|nr:Maf family protein [Acidimicrobiia bacterium]